MREQLSSALALIVNELVSNAITHAHPSGRAGAVRITLARLDDERATLIVSDDGVGYAAGPDDRGKLGLWLIRGLTDQVKGAMTTTTTDGVTARLEFAVVGGV
jgi:two-component sensor histidine kinase